MNTPPVLLVEDKDSLRAMLRHALEAQGHGVVEARDEPEAVQAMRQERPCVVLTDLKLPQGDGFGVLRASKELDPAVQVVVMTAYGSIQDAVSAVKEGAMDFLAKPVDPDHLLLMVERAMSQRRMCAENTLLKEELAERRGAPKIIGEDPSLRVVLQQLHRAAASDPTVLLEGESGTGKELFARTLHALSPRRDGPFVAINCAAIPETLLETELFGHEKGAFTGATARKPGRFEMAHKGTLFLDEIGDLPLSLQAKILRALEEKSFERVGGTQTLKVDVRVVAATNRNLKARVAERQFRDDLYFRLSVFPVQIPPLRDRPGDVVILAGYFVDKFSRDVNKPALMLSPAAIDELEAYPWPGNVRELQNCIERAVIMTEGDAIQPRHLNISVRPGAPPVVAPVDPWEQIDLSGSMADALRRLTTEVERRKIDRAIKDTNGNKLQAADALQVGLKVLVAKMRQYAIPEQYANVAATFLSPLVDKPAAKLALRNARTGRILADRLLPALDSQTRRTGLLKHTALEPGEAMVIAPTSAVHTWFMKFAIDVAFVARDGRVLKARDTVRPWRMTGAFGGFAVIEMKAGSLAAADTTRGDVLEVVEL